ncbi:MAG: hypothetical protein NTV34_21720 [Proteobacteria bacterium]|nr:hypothetical protein [Pseudomonadota bacterium]
MSFAYQISHKVMRFSVLVSIAVTASCGIKASKTSPGSKLSDVSDSAKTVERLQILYANVESVGQSVMINDQSRLFVLNKSVKQSIELISTKGLGNLKSANSLRKLVLYFIYSEQFFQFIRTIDNSKTIEAILKDTIATDGPSLRIDIGYDEDRLGTILAEHLDIIQQRLNELIHSVELPGEIRDALAPLLPRVGYVFGLANGMGDRRVSFNEGAKLCREITLTYQALDKLIGSNQFFVASQEIRGTNEFLRDFLQVNQDDL